MPSNRKRINISLDPAAYERVRRMQRKYGFKNPCSIVAAFTRIFIERLESVKRKEITPEEDNAKYIKSMFEELANVDNITNDRRKIERKKRK